MKYRVLNKFQEKHHNNTIYEKGEVYPKEGFEVDTERVEFLQKVHPEYGIEFLEIPKDEKRKEETPKKAKRKAVNKKSGEE